MLPICPYCGQQCGVYMKTRAYGWATEFFDEDGRQYEMSIEDVNYLPNQTLRCDTCGKVRRDLRWDENVRLVVPSEERGKR